MSRKSLSSVRSSLPPFVRAVYRVVSRIPRGRVLTYAAVASRAGYPGAARAVGTLMKKNSDPRRIPCHRVVRSDGRVGEYALGGRNVKIRKLKHEGVLLSATGRVLAR